MSKDNGGPAFPTVEANYHNENMRSEGLSIRDYFAAKALNGIIASGNLKQAQTLAAQIEQIEQVAMAAYSYADAMLLERAK